jgi:hypothetical protein
MGVVPANEGGCKWDVIQGLFVVFAEGNMRNSFLRVQNALQINVLFPGENIPQGNTVLQLGRRNFQITDYNYGRHRRLKECTVY